MGTTGLSGGSTTLERVCEADGTFSGNETCTASCTKLTGAGYCPANVIGAWDGHGLTLPDCETLCVNDLRCRFISFGPTCARYTGDSCAPNGLATFESYDCGTTAQTPIATLTMTTATGRYSESGSTTSITFSCDGIWTGLQSLLPPGKGASAQIGVPCNSRPTHVFLKNGGNDGWAFSKISLQQPGQSETAIVDEVTWIDGNGINPHGVTYVIPPPA